MTARGPQGARDLRASLLREAAVELAVQVEGAAGIVAPRRARVVEVQHGAGLLGAAAVLREAGALDPESPILREVCQIAEDVLGEAGWDEVSVRPHARQEGVIVASLTAPPVRR